MEGSSEDDLERDQGHRTEVDARSGTFQAFEQFGQHLLARGHYASPEIQQKTGGSGPGEG